MNDARTIQDRCEAVREELTEKAGQAGRNPETIRIIAVSKTRGADSIQAAQRAGLAHFGENRIQEARSKIPLVHPPPTWHLVGHLQTNKAREAARLFDWVHSIDSVRVAEALGRGAREADKSMGVLVQVNTTAEEAKAGCAPGEVEAVLQAVQREPHLKLAGLMTLGPVSMEEKATRRAFEACARLREEWRSRLPEGAMDVLCMGMSGDWPWAVEAGADWIRIGTAIFGERRA